MFDGSPSATVIAMEKIPELIMIVGKRTCMYNPLGEPAPLRLLTHGW